MCIQTDEVNILKINEPKDKEENTVKRINTAKSQKEINQNIIQTSKNKNLKIFFFSL